MKAPLTIDARLQVGKEPPIWVTLEYRPMTAAVFLHLTPDLFMALAFALKFQDDWTLDVHGRQAVRLDLATVEICRGGLLKIDTDFLASDIATVLHTEGEAA